LLTTGLSAIPSKKNIKGLLASSRDRIIDMANERGLICWSTYHQYGSEEDEWQTLLVDKLSEFDKVKSA